MSKPIVVGTRKSLLATTQTDQTIALLKAACPGQEFVVKTISTAGDRSSDKKILQTQQGIFVKELEDALRNKEIDIAIHSLKDMPCDMPEGLMLGAVPEREDPRDAFITRDGKSFMDLPAGSRVGTSSVRRQAQVCWARKDLKVVELRGNVDTRLRKLEAGEVDALLIATAGISRLGLASRISQKMDLRVMLCAPCQGAIGVEVRTDDVRIREIVRQIDHKSTHICVDAERSFLKHLGGGCSLPVGALAICDGKDIVLRGQVVSPEGDKRSERELGGPLDQAADIGKILAEQFLNAEGPWIRKVLGHS